MIVLVVLNYNDADTTINFVSNVKNNDLIEHIVIVDNCSTDDSFERLSSLISGKIHLVRTSENKGYASGNNHGINYAISQWNPKQILISNPDVEFKEEILEKMKKVLDKYENAAAVTCLMKCTSKIHLPVAWKLPNYIDCIMENLIILKRLLGYSKEYSEKELRNDVLNVEAIPGSFFMVNAKPFLEIGSFDENTFLYYEENILGKKFIDHGFQQYLITTDEYIHNHSVSINKNIKLISDRLKLSYISREYYCKSYLEINAVQQVLLRVTFEIGRFHYMVFTKLIRGRK